MFRNLSTRQERKISGTLQKWNKGILLCRGVRTNFKIVITLCEVGKNRILVTNNLPISVLPTWEQYHNIMMVVVWLIYTYLGKKAICRWWAGISFRDFWTSVDIFIWKPQRKSLSNKLFINFIDELHPCFCLSLAENKTWENSRCIITVRHCVHCAKGKKGQR